MGVFLMLMMTVTSQTFEPVVNVPALISCLVIAVTFSLLQIRINAVGDAAERRKEALRTIRRLKSAQLDGEVNQVTTSSSFKQSSLPTAKSLPSSYPGGEKLKLAVDAYRNALNEELSLRTIIPGVRIAAPNDPLGSEGQEDIAAAKIFLGLDLSNEDLGGDGGDLVKNGDVFTDMTKTEQKRALLLQSRRRFDGQKRIPNGKPVDEVDSSVENGLSNGAKAVLAGVALSQILLLYLLSFDPMVASDVFSSVGGEATSDGSLSSWYK
mmetsp:Transcript_2184/g.3071  ORF Transcript_2184/g.3071 Transcript_2184/m.3071 type:complete len:267 (+) Transcript_2184:96-896(+)